MKELILEFVKAMEAKKVEAKIEPSHITMIELNQAVKTALRELTNENKLFLGKVVNDYYVKST